MLSGKSRVLVLGVGLGADGELWQVGELGSLESLRVMSWRGVGNGGKRGRVGNEGKGEADLDTCIRGRPGYSVGISRLYEGRKEIGRIVPIALKR